MRIIQYDSRYRDDMIFMVLEAKNALGRVPRLNDDLLDIEGAYLDCGGMFWLAVDDNDRVIGCVGYNRADEDTAILHRLYVKYDLKHQGIGSALLNTAEAHLIANGYKRSAVHLGDKVIYHESWEFYPRHGYVETAPSHMRKQLVLEDY